MEENEELVSNPAKLEQALKPQSSSPSVEQGAHLQQTPMEEDSAVTKAEKIEWHGKIDSSEEPSTKRVKLEPSGDVELREEAAARNERRKGVTPIKAEFLVNVPTSGAGQGIAASDANAGEESRASERPADDRDSNKKGKPKGQNFNRDFGTSKDEISLCQSRAHTPEFSPIECKFGDGCKFEHDLRKYLKEWKREDLATFDGICPIWKAKGRCQVGWKCRFVGSHMTERDAGEGRKELVLVENESNSGDDGSREVGILNSISTQAKIDLLKRRIATPKADEYSEWLETNGREIEKGFRHHSKKDRAQASSANAEDENPTDQKGEMHDNRARYTEPPFLPSEKRRIYFGPETPVLAPLTTQGNLPFRRLCVDLGAQITYSEMAMSMPLVQGQKSEWALLRAHESEAEPPKYLRSSPSPTTSHSSPHVGYDNARDLRFGAQIAANKPWPALKATEILTRLCPHLRVIDLNCGCPIDLVYRQGAGSALLDQPAKLDKIVRGMNTVSGEIPITVKIRMGTKDHKPTAERLIDRLVHGGPDNAVVENGTSGTAAITLHGRSRQQRYTKRADWSYIASCAAIVERYHAQADALSDTIREPDPRTQPASGHVYFLGNGDIYSPGAYQSALAASRVSSIMLARGALIKPWLFEEIAQGQPLDKSASERLAYVERYARYGLETWGSDEVGVGTTRRFLLEWLSFAHRYVPLGILEHHSSPSGSVSSGFPEPSLQDRPPRWRGRNELETLLGSEDYRDWIRISEMFLGKAHPGFRFVPKHKSNSVEIEAEG